MCRHEHPFSHPQAAYRAGIRHVTVTATHPFSYALSGATAKSRDNAGKAKEPGNRLQQQQQQTTPPRPPPPPAAQQQTKSAGNNSPPSSINSMTSATVTPFPLPPFSGAPVRDCASKTRLSNSRSPKEVSGTSAADSAKRKASSCPRAFVFGKQSQRLKNEPCLRTKRDGTPCLCGESTSSPSEVV